MSYEEEQSIVCSHIYVLTLVLGNVSIIRSKFLKMQISLLKQEHFSFCSTSILKSYIKKSMKICCTQAGLGRIDQRIGCGAKATSAVLNDDCNGEPCRNSPGQTLQKNIQDLSGWRGCDMGVACGSLVGRTNPLRVDFRHHLVSRGKLSLVQESYSTTQC